MKKYYYWLLVVAIIVIDQLSKCWVSHYLQLGESRYGTPFFNLVLAHNYGAAFSFLNVPGGLQRWLFVVLSSVISVLLLFWLRTAQSRLQATALALILGGAVGNLIGRLFKGYVVDFLQFHWADYCWPAFNVADSAVCIGVGLLIISLFFTRKKS